MRNQAVHFQFWKDCITRICEVERELIVRTLACVRGNKARASDILGMSRRNLYNRLEEYSLRETNGHLNGRLYRNGRDSLT